MLRCHVVRPRDETPRVMPTDRGVLREARVERRAQRVRSIVQWQRAQTEIERVAVVVATSPTISGAAIAVRGGGANAVVVRGIEPASYRRIVPLDSFLVAGRLDLDGFKVVIGTEMAKNLGVSVGDRLRLRIGADSAVAANAVYTVTGLFDLGNRDLNARWVFASLRTTQSLFGLEGGASSIEVKVGEIYEAESLAREITTRTGLVADSWMAANAQLLIGLRSQSASSIMIQVFVVLAVALGIASVLAVSVVQKSREIGILRATGTSRRQVLRIFLAQGAILGVLGSAVGIAFGIALGFAFSRVAINPDGSPTFPVSLDGVLYLRSSAIAIGAGIASAVVPARRAAKMNPADSIRSA